MEFLSIVSEEKLNIPELRAWKITLEWFLMASLSQFRGEKTTGTWDEAGSHFVTEQQNPFQESMNGFNSSWSCRE